VKKTYGFTWLLCAVMTFLLLFAVALPAQTTVQQYMGAVPLDSSTMILAQFPNGSKLIIGQASEDLTLSTGGTTTDTAGVLLPAGALILGVNGTVTTTITAGCTGWALGDPTTAARFAASNTTLTAGTSSIGVVHATTGVASATTGLYQSAGAKVRVTCATAAPGAGKVRISVSYLLFTPPSQ
jgi:hypothetical protein